MAGLVESGIHLFFFAGILLGAMMLAQPAVFQRVVTRGVPLTHTTTPSVTATVTESVSQLLTTEIAPAPVVCAVCEVCAPPMVCECEEQRECPAQTQTVRELSIEERREIVDAAFALLNNPNPLLVNIGVNGMPFLVSLSSLEESYVKAKALEFCADNVLKLKIKKEIVADGCAQAVAKQLFEEIKSNRGVLLSDVVFAENNKPPAMPAPQEPLIKPVPEKTEPLIKPVIEPVVKPIVEPVVKPVVSEVPAASQREAQPVRESVKEEQEAVPAQRTITFPPGQNVLVEENGRIVLVRIPLRDGPEYALSFDVQTQTLAETVEAFCLSFQLDQAQLESCFKTVSVYVKDQLVAAGFVQAPEEQQETQAEAAGEEKAAQEAVATSVSDVASEAEPATVPVSVEETVSETAVEPATVTESEAVHLSDAETAVAPTESVVAVANAVVDSSETDAETPVSVADTEVAVVDAVETSESTEPAVVAETTETVVTEEEVNNSDNTREVHGTVQLGSKRVSLPLLASLSLNENAQRYCELHFTESLSRLLRDEGFNDWTEENCAGFLAYEVQKSFVADEE